MIFLTIVSLISYFLIVINLNETKSSTVIQRKGWKYNSRFLNTDKSSTSSIITVTSAHQQHISELPECSPWAVCNKIDTYSTPWIESHCRCGPGTRPCSESLDPNDGHTISDKSRLFKICEPIRKLPVCRFFRDVTWTLTSHPDNRTSQKAHCVCPRNSVAYIFKHEPFSTESGIGYIYKFACSPETKLRCQIKEPCRLFTVRKRQNVEEVNTNTLCQCLHGHRCPTHHNHSFVIPGTTYPLDHIKTYTGYCSPDYKYYKYLTFINDT